MSCFLLNDLLSSDVDPSRIGRFKINSSLVFVISSGVTCTSGYENSLGVKLLWPWMKGLPSVFGPFPTRFEWFGLFLSVFGVVWCISRRLLLVYLLVLSLYI